MVIRVNQETQVFGFLDFLFSIDNACFYGHMCKCCANTFGRISIDVVVVPVCSIIIITLHGDHLKLFV